MASLRPRVEDADVPPKQTFWGLNLQTKFIILLTSLWIFVYPWIEIVSPSSTRSLILNGVGAILTALCCVASLLEKLLQKQESDIERKKQSRQIVDQFQLTKGMPTKDTSSSYPPGSM